MDKRLPHFIEVGQLDLNTLIKLYREADKIEEMFKNIDGRALLIEILKGRVLVNLFWQQSSRTRNSFAVAAQRLGASINQEVGIEKEVKDNDKTKKSWTLVYSSEAKGESFDDTIRTFSALSYDALIMRYFEEGWVKRASEIMDNFEYGVPVINAGDGKGEHPTQALLDLRTILKRYNIDLSSDGSKLRNISIAFIGDMNGRTIHSVSLLLAKFGTKMIFISREALRLPENFKKRLDNLGVSYKEQEHLDSTDVWYVTRDQKEYRSGEYAGEYYVIDKKNLERYKPDIILHPFPRNEEIPMWSYDDPFTWEISVDKEPQAAYFEQMRHGLFVRAALLKYTLAPNIEFTDLWDRRLRDSFIKQCAVCSRVESKLMGWSEKILPLTKLPKVVCPRCQIN